MVDRRGWRVVAALCPLVMVAGCAGTGSDTARNLDARMQAGLAPQVAMRQAAVQPLPNGTRIELAEQALFPPGSAMLDDRGRFILASVVEGLMAPQLMLIEVTPPAGTPAYLQQARVAAVRQFFTDYALGPQLQVSEPSPAAPSPPAAGSQALAVTVLVQGPPSGA